MSLRTIAALVAIAAMLAASGCGRKAKPEPLRSAFAERYQTSSSR